MKTTTSIVSLFSLLSLAVAAPASNVQVGDGLVFAQGAPPVVNLTETPNTVSKRAPYSLHYCNAINFFDNEGCRTDQVEPYNCYNLPAAFTNSISSIEAADEIVCALYMGPSCTGSVLYNVRRVGDLRAYNGANDNAESVLCWLSGC
ncbi:hypothetical protein N656DRAFT_827657 [Canariomyces notabilis]|uniref:Uncharacterized protein n=1 Tax=Canariomyces notabilis TaxID=2074819 RepID=A0AAN6YVN3_9PEZI|nr:hypothetical protein N656DRAFT_827657 [Canariomyces arenarius]